MAYKTSSGSSFFCLDGVPFTISDKFRPPKKVTLPLKYETGNPSQFLFLEYDSTTEERILATFEAERQLKYAAETAAAQTGKKEILSNEAAAVTDAEMVVQSSENDRCQNNFGNESTTMQSQPNHKQFGIPINAGSQLPQIQPTNSSQKQSHANAAYRMMNGNILVPTPIALSGESIIQDTHKMVSNIDLKDFENEQDPFENLSLKVINDIEELDKVFLATSKSQLNVSSAGKTSNSQDDDSGSDVKKNTASHSTAYRKDDRMFPDDNVGARIKSIPAQGSVLYLPLHNSAMLVDYMNSSNVTPLETMNHRWLPSLDVPVGRENIGKIPKAILTSDLQAKSIIQQQELPIMPNRDFKADLHLLPLSSSSSEQPFMIDGRRVFSSGSSTVNGCHVEPSASSIHTQLLSNSCGASGLNRMQLRSAKSNPDLSAIEPSTVNKVESFGRHTPPIFNTRNMLPESAGAIWASGATTQTLSGGRFPQVHGFTEPTEADKPLSIEGKLYSSLSHEAQNFVDFIMSMGFPKLQTIKAVEKLGINEKSVLDHLCSFAQLREKGYNANDVEKSLFLFEDDLIKAEKYAKLASTFRSMGFDEDKISTALVKCSLDEESSLDWLTS